MKPAGLILRSALFITLLSISVRSEQIEIFIDALIDGRDQLILQGGTLQWHHLEFAAVGRHEGRNVPTYITTHADGEVVLNRVAWIPDWPVDPPDWVQFEALSSKFLALRPELFAAPMDVRLEYDAREPPRIVESPSAANEFRLVVEFWDPLESSSIHKLRLFIDRASIFRRGETTGDGQLNIADPIRILDWLFLGGVLDCVEAADTNDSGTIEITDAVVLLEYLFSGTAVPSAPFVTCGADPTKDRLGCEGGKGCDG